ncbi:hypothetical protein Btru_021241 [Bulinus truncatus]|nr:hypothetical protein Btru_021241 [Bulinus truncatus]
MYSAMLVASVYLVVMVHSLDSDRGPMQPSHMIEPVLDRPQAPPPPQPCCALPMTGDRWECIVWYCHDVPPPLNCCVIQLKNPIRPDPSLREITNPQCVCLCESAMNSLPVSPQIDTMRKSEFSNFTQMTQKPLLAITETIQRPLSSNAVTAKNPLTASTEVSQSTLSTIKDPTKKNPEASSAQAAQDDVWSSAQDTAQSRELSTSYSVDMMESRTEAIDLDKREKSAGYTAAITNGVLIGGFCVIFGVALFVFMRRRKFFFSLKRKKLKGKPDAKRPITNHPMVRTVCGNAESSLSVSISEKKTIKLEEISRKNIRLLNIIGKGTFGTVVKAEVYRLNMKWTAKTDDWITVAVKMTSGE